VAILSLVSRHDDFLWCFAFPKLANKLLDSVFLQERMIHRVNEHRCGLWNAFHCAEKGTQLSTAPPFIDYYLRRAWHRTPDVFGIASEHHDGTPEARTVLDRDEKSRLLPKLRERLRHAQFF